MNVNRRTQTERSAATRGQLIAAATPLFTEHGFGGVATETIVKAAGVTRGALYHQFADKTELFAAVVEEVEQGITGHIAEVVATSGLEDPMEAMKLGTEAWLDACGDPEVQQIILIDAPAVLGWERWRDIGMKYGIGLVEGMLNQAIEVGSIPNQPVSPLAHILIGAMDEAALYVTRADDQELARREAGEIISRLIDAVATGPGSAQA